MTKREKTARRLRRRWEKKAFRQAMAKELREHRSSFIVFSILRILVLAVLVRQIMLASYESAFFCVLTLLLLYVPSWVQVKLRIELPPPLEITILCFIFAAEILGEVNAFYVVVPNWDTMLHTLNGFLAAAVGFSLVILLNDDERLTFHLSPFFLALVVYGDNVIEKHGINRDSTGDREKTRYLCGKQGIFTRDRALIRPGFIRQLETRASTRSASFFHALGSPGRPHNGGGEAGAYRTRNGAKPLKQGHLRAKRGPLGPSRKSQQQTKRTGFAAHGHSIAETAPEGKRASCANGALIRA